jgi:catechol 2,3-dioxygenase-like lactoylglutathione lyase family enzyme
MSRFATYTIGLFVAACAAVPAALAQRGTQPAVPAPTAATPARKAAPAPEGSVLGVGTYIHLVSDVNNSIAFYSDLLGAMPNARGNAPAGPREFAPNEVVSNLYNTPGSRFRGGTIRIAGSEIAGAELVDWDVAGRKRVHPRVQDPGTLTLLLTVRDIEPALAAFSRNGASVVTPGGRPVGGRQGAGTSQTLLGRDPDGFLIEVRQLKPAPATTAPATSNIIGASLRITVADLDRAVRLYRDALGFVVQPPVTLALTPNAAAVAGLRRGQVRRALTVVPGTSVSVNLIEYTGVPRRTLGADVHGVGSSVLRLRVKDIDATIAALKARGVTVASANGQPVTFANGQRMAILSDPNGMFIQAVQAAPPQPASGRE